MYKAMGISKIEKHVYLATESNNMRFATYYINPLINKYCSEFTDWKEISLNILFQERLSTVDAKENVSNKKNMGNRRVKYNDFLRK